MADFVESGLAAWHEGDFSLAERLFRQALSFDKSSEAAVANLVAVLTDLHRQPEALDVALTALKSHPRSTAILCNTGILYATGGDPGTAIRYFDEALGIDAAYIPASLNRTNALLHACDWSGIENLRARIIAQHAAGPQSAAAAGWQEHVLPYGAIQLDLPAAIQRDVADYHARKISAAWPRLVPSVQRGRGGRSRIGYLSGDFYEHATSFLAAEYLSEHDTDQFEVHCYSFGPPDDGAHARQIRASAHMFHDIRNLSHTAAAQLIRNDQIDVLVDLKGHTGGARPEIVALHPAPITVNFLGHPGTLGGVLADVLIGDEVVTPQIHASLFSEALLRLPGCYQPNGRLMPLAPAPERASLGLPADKIVLCCFNAHYKISRTMFGMWMNVLRHSPESVLWLLNSSVASSRNLANAAGEAGISPDRVVFAPVVDHETHLRRLQAADLFLDTDGVCAHTLASDALRAGVPIIALPGESFASRVSASLLATAGLQDLICNNMAEYTGQALHYANTPLALQALRQRVKVATRQSTLFDPEHFCRKFETAIRALVAQRQDAT